jgi:hypothetical protein
MVRGAFVRVTFGRDMTATAGKNCDVLVAALGVGKMSIVTPVLPF